ncbi:hypothetical protein NS226_04095 [Aureimonas ureilytica]|uniref:Uncharacterized protein n=1 Tax=Aureimonas ureilytica TaxID=401562 RepID=A0A175RDF6_9HYPH|nr:hypothetical protein [Aureimonas ureilytica]KTQ97823.1 hypothetical protein NS226_04095 [Aureimonas ureilytica]
MIGRALPATLRAIVVDPDADPGRAAGIRVLPWQTDPADDRHRTAEVTRDDVPVALLEVTGTSPGFWTVLLWRDRGRREYRFGDRSEFGWSTSLGTAAAAAEVAGVAFALGHLPHLPQVSA